MKVSVALTTYNGEKYLEEQLRSLALQSRMPDELIVGDDRSSDGTLAILRQFAQSAPFPVDICVNDANLGFQRNFARTLLRCSGDVIFFCDQDDIWYPDKIAVCVDAFTSAAAPRIISHDAHLASDPNNHGGLTLGAQFEAAGGDRGGDMIYGCCMAFDSFFARFFHGDLAHSHDCWLVEIGRLLDARWHLDLPLILYRRHGGNATSSHHTGLSPSNRFQALRRRARQALSIGIAAEVASTLQYVVDLIAAFRRNSAHVIARFGSDQLDSALANLENRERHLRARQALHGLPRGRRLIHLVRSRLSGEYKSATLIGLLRDLLA